MWPNQQETAVWVRGNGPPPPTATPIPEQNHYLFIKEAFAIILGVKKFDGWCFGHLCNILLHNYIKGLMGKKQSSNFFSST